MTEMTVTQQQTLGPVVFKDRLGNLADVEGPPTWASSDESIVSVEVSPDGLSATVKGRGVGEADVRGNADADLGEGVKPVIWVNHYKIGKGGAVLVEVPEQPVEEQP